MSLLKIFEAYNEDASKGTDYFDVADGSEISQNYLNTNNPSNGDGQGNTIDNATTNHPNYPVGEYTLLPGDKHALDDNDTKGTNLASGQEGVDDYHADGGIVSVGFLSLFASGNETPQEDDFLTSPVTGVANSPQVMHDGIPVNDVVVDKNIFNNYKGDKDNVVPLLEPENVYKDQSILNSKVVASQEDESNIEALKDPQDIKHKRNETNNPQDYARLLTDHTTMSVNPLNQGLGLEEENLYSGVDHTASFLSLFIKTADPNGVMPSVNPNSGRDPMDDEMDADDVKQLGKSIDEVGNYTDKMNYDLITTRKHAPYDNKLEQDDPDMSFWNSNGPYGMGGDGQTMSGVSN